MAGGAYLAGRCAWQGACMVGGMCAGKTATKVGGTHPTGMHSCSSNRVATAQGKQGKQGIWFLLFPDRENTGNLVLTQGKIC